MKISQGTAKSPKAIGKYCRDNIIRDPKEHEKCSRTSRGEVGGLLQERQAKKSAQGAAPPACAHNHSSA